MNEAPQLELVELGDAKEATKGPSGPRIENNEVTPFRQL